MPLIDQTCSYKNTHLIHASYRTILFTVESSSDYTMLLIKQASSQFLKSLFNDRKKWSKNYVKRFVLAHELTIYRSLYTYVAYVFSTKK